VGFFVSFFYKQKKKPKEISKNKTMSRRPRNRIRTGVPGSEEADLQQAILASLEMEQAPVNTYEQQLQQAIQASLETQIEQQLQQLTIAGPFGSENKSPFDAPAFTSSSKGWASASSGSALGSENPFGVPTNPFTSSKGWASASSGSVLGSSSGASASGASGSVLGSSSGASGSVLGSSSGASASGASGSVLGSSSGASGSVLGSYSGASASVLGSSAGASGCVLGSSSGASASSSASSSKNAASTKCTHGSSSSNYCPRPWAPLLNQPYKQATALYSESLCYVECGGGGDCMFHAIAHGISQGFPELIPPEWKAKRDKSGLIRKWLAESLTNANIERFLETYQLEQLRSRLPETVPALRTWATHPETWNPLGLGATKDLTNGNRIAPKVIVKAYDIPSNIQALLNPKFIQRQDSCDPNHKFPPENLSDWEKKLWIRRQNLVCVIQKVVQKPGFVFQGDDEALEYLSKGNTPLKQYSIGFWILDSRTGPECRSFPSDEPRKYYMLLIHSPGHWQLGGLADQEHQVRIVFERDQLPAVLTHLFKHSCMGIPIPDR